MILKINNNNNKNNSDYRELICECLNCKLRIKNKFIQKKNQVITLNEITKTEN